MQTLTSPRTETIPNFVRCDCPPLEVGAEKDPALSFAAGVEFELRFHPYARRIFRTALIVTHSLARAKTLEREIYQKAWRSYYPMPASDFTRWLKPHLQRSFSDYALQ